MGKATNKQKQTIPRAALSLREEVSIQQLAEGDKGPRRFSMLANSGEIIPNHWYWGNFAVDLSGLQVGRQKRPTLREHDRERIVGFTDSIKITDRGVEVSGVFSDTEDARFVQARSDEGFPWEASFYVPPMLIEKVPAGMSAEVNGRTLVGPGHIFRKSKLREVSFATLGADDNTPSTALSESADVEIECESTGDPSMDLSKLTADELRNGRPDLAATFAQEGLEKVRSEAEAAAKSAAAEAVTAALAAERQRVAAILGEASAMGLIDEGVKFALQGIAVEAASLKLKDAKIAELSSKSPQSPGPNGDTTPQPEALSDEDKAKAEWSKDSKLRAEFRNNEAAYLAWCRANSAGLAKIYGKQ